MAGSASEGEENGKEQGGWGQCAPLGAARGLTGRAECQTYPLRSHRGTPREGQHPLPQPCSHISQRPHASPARRALLDPSNPGAPRSSGQPMLTPAAPLASPRVTTPIRTRLSPRPPAAKGTASPCRSSPAAWTLPTVPPSPRCCWPALSPPLFPLSCCWAPSRLVPGLHSLMHPSIYSRDERLHMWPAWLSVMGQCRGALKLRASGSR